MMSAADCYVLIYYWWMKLNVYYWGEKYRKILYLFSCFFNQHSIVCAYRSWELKVYRLLCVSALRHATPSSGSVQTRPSVIMIPDVLPPALTSTHTRWAGAWIFRSRLQTFVPNHSYKPSQNRSGALLVTKMFLVHRAMTPKPIMFRRKRDGNPADEVPSRTTMRGITLSSVTRLF